MYWIHLHSTFGYKMQVVNTIYQCIGFTFTVPLATRGKWSIRSINVLDPPSQYLRLQEASSQYDLSMYWIHLHSTFGYKRQVVNTIYQCIGSTFTVPLATRCKWSIRSINVLDSPSQYLWLQDASGQYDLSMYWIHLHSTFGYKMQVVNTIYQCIGSTFTVPSATRCKWSIRSINVLDSPSQYLWLQEASSQDVLQCIGSTFTVPSATRGK